MSERTRARRLLLLLLVTAGAALAHDEDTSHAHTPHFDAPQHGGVVLQSRDLHYELVASQEGKQLQVWLSDARRRPLPAAEARDLVVEVVHSGHQTDLVDMRINDDGSCWIGAVQLKDLADIVRIGFTYRMMVVSGSTKYETLLHPPTPSATPDRQDRGHQEPRT